MKVDARSGALRPLLARERSGVKPQRRPGDGRLFDMSASQAFKAGVVFHHVHAALRARRADFKASQYMLL
jgi:hypothetical protein